MNSVRLRKKIQALIYFSKWAAAMGRTWPSVTYIQRAVKLSSTEAREGEVHCVVNKLTHTIEQLFANLAIMILPICAYWNSLHSSKDFFKIDKVNEMGWEWEFSLAWRVAIWRLGPLVAQLVPARSDASKSRQTCTSCEYIWKCSVIMWRQKM